MAEQIEWLLAAGKQARRENRSDMAAQHYAAALAEARVLGENLRVAHIARHLGEIYLENGLSSSAEPVLKEAVEIYRSSLDTKVLDLANALRALALLHDSLGDHRPAQELWQEARSLYLAIGIVDGVSECNGHLPAGCVR